MPASWPSLSWRCPAPGWSGGMDAGCCTVPCHPMGSPHISWCNNAEGAAGQCCSFTLWNCESSSNQTANVCCSQQGKKDFKIKTAQSLGIHPALLRTVPAPTKTCPQLARGPGSVELAALWCALSSPTTDFFQAFLTARSLKHRWRSCYHFTSLMYHVE